MPIKGTQDADIITEAWKKDAVLFTNNIKDFRNMDILALRVTENQKTATNVENFIQAVQNFHKAATLNPSLISERKVLSLYDYWPK